MQATPLPFHRATHLEFIHNLEQNKTLYSIGGYVRNHLRMGGAYWAITSLLLLKKPLAESQVKDVVSWIKECQNPDGGFGGNKGHDSHITNTLYALLVLFQLGHMEAVDLEKTRGYVHSLYKKNDGSFMGDAFGEVDTRFVYSGLYALVLLEEPLPQKSVDFLLKCINNDGGIGGQPDVESHAAYIFCGVSAFALLNKMSRIPVKKVKQFLGSRQTKLGGFNGRPEKLPDLCYSWWVLSSLHSVNTQIMNSSVFFNAYMQDDQTNPNVSPLAHPKLTNQKNVLLSGINTKKLESFILECQDPEDGGMSDRPGNMTDIFHTFFGLAALSLIDHKKYDLEEIDAVFAIPKKHASSLRARII